MNRGVLPFVGSLLFTVGCGLLLDAAPPRDDAAIGQGMDAGGSDAAGSDAARDDTGGEIVDARPGHDAPGDVPPDGRALDAPRPADAGRFECGGDAECTTGTPCVEGTCGAFGRCSYTVLDGAACAGGGECRGGLCQLPMCGNGEADPGEECDIPAGLSAEGCIDCRFACSGTSCDDGNPCNGVEACVTVPSGRVCRTRPPSLICTPSTPCHSSFCVTGATGEAECRETLVEPDLDGDGYAVSTECGAQGADCDDEDPDRNPGLPEICNSGAPIDDDCDPDTSAGALVRWCPDRDLDGFGDLSGAVSSCTRPAGSFTLDCTDCWDAPTGGAAAVHPGQTEFFTAPYCPSGGACSFDYDCNTVLTLEVDREETCRLLSFASCGRGDGWARDVGVPGCGARGGFVECVGAAVICGQRAPVSRLQGCR